MSSNLRVRVGLLVVAALVVQGGLVTAEAQQPLIKVAIVDLERVIVMSTLGQQLQGQLEQLQKQVQAEGEQMTAEANELRSRLAESGQSLPEEQRADLQRQYEEKALAIRRFRDDKQRQGEKTKGEGLRQIESKLDPIFQQIRDEGGYDLILNNVPGIVIMARNDLDITEEVVKRLNAATAGAAGGG